MLRLISKIICLGRPSVRQAYEKGDVSASSTLHTKEHSHAEHHTISAEYLADLVLGGIDGIITTFAVVAGVVGASMSSGVIIVLGLANLLADGLSMAVGNYLGVVSEEDYYNSERARESWEIENIPEHERQEVREIYQEKGFDGELLERVVSQITANKDVWLETMMLDELGIVQDKKNPLIVGAVTFFAFLMFGSVPLLAYIYAYLAGVENTDQLFVYCIASTGIALFGVGAARAYFTLRSWFRSGMEILMLGGAAGAVAYYVGVMLKGLV